jgi:hypothetical protein
MAPAAGRIAAFQNALIVDGQVAGTWRPGRSGGKMTIDVRPVRSLTAATERALRDASSRFAHFAGAQMRLAIA